MMENIVGAALGIAAIILSLSIFKLGGVFATVGVVVFIGGFLIIINMFAPFVVATYYELTKRHTSGPSVRGRKK